MYWGNKGGIKMKKRYKKLKLTLLASLVGTSLVLPQVTIQAQTDEAAMEACPIMVGGEAIYTESTLYPTISYELIDANLPADRVKIDASTLFSDDWAISDGDHEANAYYQNLLELETYRDYSIWPMYILTYDSGDLAVLAPINMSEDLLEFYSVIELLDAQNEDLYHKLISDYMHAFSDDLDEIYHLSKGFPTSIFADGKANLQRAEAIFANIPEDDENYEQALSLMDQISFKYFVLEGRYNNACGADLYYDYFVYDNVEDQERASELVDFIDASLQKMPLDLQQRLFDIRVIRHDELSDRTEDENLMAKAYSERILYFSDQMEDDPTWVYFMVGQILDLSTYMPKDTFYEEYTSYSLADEWQTIHNNEWLDEANEDAWTNDSFNSFSFAYAAYALQKYDDAQPSDFGHENMDLTERPETEAYFDDLFNRLSFN